MYKDRIKHSLEKAEKYSSRKAEKHTKELLLINQAFSEITNQVKTVLDAPCGVGRASIFLAQKGYQVTATDLGEGALKVAKEKIEQENLDICLEKTDIESLPYSDKQFDATLCFRFFHHLPDKDIQQRVINELTRVSKDYVVISYFNNYSYTSIKRLLRYKITGKKSVQHSIHLNQLSQHFAKNNFELLRSHFQNHFLHTLDIAIYKRID